MKRHEQERELADPIPLLDPPDGPNAESLEAIHEGDAFFATGNPGRFDKDCNPRTMKEQDYMLN